MCFYLILSQVERPRLSGKTSPAQLLSPSSMTASPSPQMFLPGETHQTHFILGRTDVFLSAFELLMISHTSLVQVLVSRLPPDPRDGGFGHAAVQGADLCALHGQVCSVCKDERPGRVQTEVLLYDRRQGGQDPGAAGELRRGGQEQRHRGT